MASEQISMCTSLLAISSLPAWSKSTKKTCGIISNCSERQSWRRKSGKVYWKCWLMECLSCSILIAIRGSYWSTTLWGRYSKFRRTVIKVWKIHLKKDRLVDNRQNRKNLERIQFKTNHLEGWIKTEKILTKVNNLMTTRHKPNEDIMKKWSDQSSTSSFVLFSSKLSMSTQTIPIATLMNINSWMISYANKWITLKTQSIIKVTRKDYYWKFWIQIGK